MEPTGIFSSSSVGHIMPMDRGVCGSKDGRVDNKHSLSRHHHRQGTETHILGLWAMRKLTTKGGPDDGRDDDQHDYLRQAAS